MHEYISNSFNLEKYMYENSDSVLLMHYHISGSERKKGGGGDEGYCAFFLKLSIYTFVSFLSL